MFIHDIANRLNIFTLLCQQVFTVLIKFSAYTFQFSCIVSSEIIFHPLNT